MAINTIYYSDISKIGKDFTGGRDIAKLTNEQAVLESIKNLLSTEPGQRIMNPSYGCSLTQYLFEQLDSMTTAIIKRNILVAISVYEPRVENLQIDIIEMPDINSYVVNIRFNMKTSSTTQTLTIDLNKIR